MKKILSSLLFSFITITSLYSADGTSTLLEQLRAEKVKEFKNNIDAISARVNSYILNTADTTVTRKELQVQDSLPYYFFNNFKGITCSNDGTYCNEQTGSDGIQISVLSKTLELTNVLGSTQNTYVAQAFTNNSDNSRVITSELNYTVRIPLDTTTSNFISLIGKIPLVDLSAHIGLTSPSDTAKTWYLANGTGGFDIKKYNTSLSKWVELGATGVNGKSSVQASSETELFKIPCLKNDSGFVVGSSIASKYICTADGVWITINGSSTYASDTNSSDTNSSDKLDAVPCVSDGASNCYANPTAIAYGKAYVSSTIYSLVDGAWVNGVDYLIDDRNSVIDEITTTEKKWALAGKDIAGKAGNGLYYTGTPDPFDKIYQPKTEFGVFAWTSATMGSMNETMNTTNICSTRGMRLPTLAETQGTIFTGSNLAKIPTGGSPGDLTGVPSHPSGYTWTATSWTHSSDYYWRWTGANTQVDSFVSGNYVRCVR